MSELTARDLHAVLDVVYTLNEDTSEAEVPLHVLTRLGELMGCDSLSYSRVDHTTGLLLGTIVEPAEADLSCLPGFHTVFDQHPGFAAYRCGRLKLGTSAALTDLANPPGLRKLALYTDFQQACGINDQLLCVTQVGNKHGTVLAFNRASLRFSPRDRAIADLATRHLAQVVARRQRLATLIAAVNSVGRDSEQEELISGRLSELTTREREVVEHIVGGATDREIARSLAISERTVHKHLQRIYHKCGLGNRTSLIALVHGRTAPTRALRP